MPTRSPIPALTLACASLVIVPSLVLAAAPPPDAGQLLQEAQPVPAIPAPARPDVEGKPAALPTPRADGPAIEVNGWQFKGNTVFSNEQLAALLADTLGKKLDLTALDNAVGRITQFYRQSGYPLALALLPRQQIKSGQIEISIIEGRIESVTLEPTSTAHLAPGLLADFLSRVPLGQVAQDGAINRLALVTNEQSGLTARVILKPGQEPGATALQLKLDQSKPWALSAFLDNQGSYATGRNRLGFTGSIFNQAGRGDALDMSLVSTSGNQTFGSVDYSLALSGAGDRLGLGVSHLSYGLGGSFTGQGSGTADTVSLNYRYPLIRTPLLNLTAQARAERKQLKDHNPVSENNRHSDVLSLGVAASGVDVQGQSTAYAYLYSGRLGFDDAGAAALDQGNQGAHVQGDFSKLTYGFSRYQRLAEQFGLYGSVTGQVAGSHRLDSSERLALGGVNGVRAYSVGETTGDSGYIATAELRYLPTWLRNSQFALFYDAGRIIRNANIDPSVDGDAKRGYGVSAAYLVSNVQLRGSLAWRSTGKPASDPGAKGQQLYVQLSTSF